VAGKPRKKRLTKRKFVVSIARQEIEIAVRAGEEVKDVSAVGTLGLCPDVDVLAMCSYCDQDGAVLLLVTTNALKTAFVLNAIGFQCNTSRVVLVGPLERTGVVPMIGAHLANAGIGVLCSYVSRTERGKHYLVVKTTENARAVCVLENCDAIMETPANGLGGVKSDLRQEECAA
jgi:hypothetical protein